ncbi:MAG TPA: beta-galactosidase [Armatimonadota bacterium]|jgi:hypothetical protein
MPAFRRYCLLILAFAMVNTLHAASVQLGLPLPTAHGESVAAITAALNIAQAAHVQRVTIAADWPRIQPTATTWNFAWLDAVIDAARARQLQVVLVLGPAPKWTVSYLGANPGPAEVRRACPVTSAYAAYASAVARRYQQRVTYYQLWERPACGTLLAMPKDVYALYAAGAQAVHAVSASLRVIAMDPGDLNLGWIADYLKAAKGSARADILQLAPVRYTLSTSTFAWRLQTLRERVLPAQSPPTLWAQLPLTPEMPANGLALAAQALICGVPELTFASVSDACVVALPSPTVLSATRFLSPLLAKTWRGWAQLAPNVQGCIVGDQRDMRVLALPVEDDVLHFLTAKQPAAWGVMVTDNTLTVTPAAGSATTYTVRGPLPVAVTAQNSVLLAGVNVAPSAAGQDFRPAPISASSVSLDLSGADPAGIHLLRGLSGGLFNQYTHAGRTVISTVRDTAPWIHVDVPDGFLFYNIARVPVEVTVQVLGATAAQKSGFSIYYDAISGMANSPWQWIAVGPEQVYSYTVRLNDALFSNKDGYDFRLNMGGSTDNIRLIGLTVRKVSLAKK